MSFNILVVQNPPPHPAVNSNPFWEEYLYFLELHIRKYMMHIALVRATARRKLWCDAISYILFLGIYIFRVFYYDTVNNKSEKNDWGNCLGLRVKVAALTLLKMYIYINGSFCWLVLALGVSGLEIIKSLSLLYKAELQGSQFKA